MKYNRLHKIPIQLNPHAHFYPLIIRVLPAKSSVHYHPPESSMQ